MNERERLALVEALYEREKHLLGPATDHAVSVFIEMTRHVAGCVPCQINDVAFQAAYEREDHARAQRFSHQFCPTMNKLSEEFAEATEAAFGPGDGDSCRHCGNPIRRDTRAEPNRSPTGWTHGRWREAPDWQGKRCPGRLTGAEPTDRER